jgi:hypothetical protein
MELKTLSLRMKSEFIEKIKSGEKTEEYRSPTDFYCNRMVAKITKEGKPIFKHLLLCHLKLII